MRLVPLALVLTLFAPHPAAAGVTASIVGSQLHVMENPAGGPTDDAITLRLVGGDATRVEVLDGGHPVNSFPRDQFEAILVDAGGGNDTVLIDDGNGTFTDLELTTLLGGVGNDALTGGGGGEVISGGAGNDTLIGRGGDDRLVGGDGHDALSGGPGDDTHTGGAGDDVMTWNPGDGSDVMDGEAGADKVQVNGSSAGEQMFIDGFNGRVSFARLSQTPFDLDIGTTETLVVAGNAGEDHVVAGAGLAALIAIVIDGGDDNDTITGGDGADTLLGGNGVDILTGGNGDDTLVGGPGNDTHFGSGGNDVMIWSSGDGTDVMEGQAGTDAVHVNGGSAAEMMTVIANGPRVEVRRATPPLFSLDIAATETLLINADAGNDTVTVGPGLAALIAVNVNGGPGADTIATTASSLVTATGGADADTLDFDALGEPVHHLGSTIAAGGQARATFSEIETVNLLNTVSPLPTVAITSPTADASTSATSPFLALAGNASDEAGIASVTWANSRGGSGAATGRTSWRAAHVPLLAGTNVISVTAEDASGNRMTDVLTVTVTSMSYYFAEGATGTFFDLDILVANPNPVPAPIAATFLKTDGSTVTRDFTVQPQSRLTIRADDIAGVEADAVSTVIVSTDAVPVVVERSMFWDGQYYGSHGGNAVDGPRTRWLFAEGSQGFFDTYVLLANATSSTASVTLTFLTESSGAVTRTFEVAPTSRLNVFTGLIPELVGTSFSIVVDSTVPIVAERAMYFGTARSWDGGHESAGLPEAGTEWFLAEGATGTFFDTYVLVGNPNAAAANVTFTFLTSDGASVARSYVVAGNSRLTLNIEDQGPELADTAVSTTVTSDVPVIVERAMYWPGPASNWYEAHNSAAGSAVGLKWGLAEGRVGFQQEFETYILLANPSPTSPADVRVTFLRSNGTTVVKTYTVHQTSRLNVHVNSMVPELSDETFGALVEITNGVGIFVERALYSNAFDTSWAAGTSALGTRLP